MWNVSAAVFNQGDEGKSWYIILKGSVNVVIYGKVHGHLVNRVTWLIGSLG